MKQGRKRIVSIHSCLALSGLQPPSVGYCDNRNLQNTGRSPRENAEGQGKAETSSESGCQAIKGTGGMPPSDWEASGEVALNTEIAILDLQSTYLEPATVLASRNRAGSNIIFVFMLL